MIELEPQLQEQTFLQNARLHIGMADGAQENGVVLAQLVDGARGEDLAGFEVVLAAKVEVVELIGEPFQLGHRRQHLESLAGNLGPGAVAANDGDFVLVASTQVQVPARVARFGVGWEKGKILAGKARGDKLRQSGGELTTEARRTRREEGEAMT